MNPRKINWNSGRGHGHLTWVLDVTFDEDQCRACKDHAPRSPSMLREVCLSLLKHDTTIKGTLRGNRYLAVLDESFLEPIPFPVSSK